VVTGCKTDYQHLPAFSKNKQLQAVILTPAGSNSPHTYDAVKKEFKPAIDAGLTAKIKFLPMPGNWGFIPSTKYHNAAQEDKLLNVLVLSESVPTGTIQELTPISTLLLNIEDELTPIIIAIPARPSEQVVAATDYEDFANEHSAVKEILQKWFLNYQPEKKVRLVGWKDEKYTEDFIRKWLQ
jgi:inorganic pyrophosphatase